MPKTYEYLDFRNAPNVSVSNSMCCSAAVDSYDSKVTLTERRQRLCAGESDWIGLSTILGICKSEDRRALRVFSFSMGWKGRVAVDGQSKRTGRCP